MADHCPACDAMILGNEVYCRQCAAPLRSHLPPTSARMRWLVRSRRLILVNSFLAIGPAIMLVTPQSALVGGPVLIVLGCGLVLAGRRACYPSAVQIGRTQIIIALCWIPVIWMLWPVSSIQLLAVPLLLVGLVALYVASLCVWQSHSARDLRLICDRCGYCIKGQIVPRCPECGTPFDPARLIDADGAD